ncbi:hypothetical protein ACFX2A_046130 [Malus domestica]
MFVLWHSNLNIVLHKFEYRPPDEKALSDCFPSPGIQLSAEELSKGLTWRRRQGSEGHQWKGCFPYCCSCILVKLAEIVRQHEGLSQDFACSDI